MKSRDILQKLESILRSDGSVRDKTRRKLELLSVITPPVTDKGWELLLFVVSDTSYCPYCIELKERLGVKYVKEHCRNECQFVGMANHFRGEDVYRDCHEMEPVTDMISAAVEQDIDRFRRVCSEAMEDVTRIIAEADAGSGGSEAR